MKKTSSHSRKRKKNKQTATLVVSNYQILSSNKTSLELDLKEIKRQFKRAMNLLKCTSPVLKSNVRNKLKDPELNNKRKRSTLTKR
jgi:hypothetical protein